MMIPASMILQARNKLLEAAIRFVEIERRIAAQKPNDLVFELMTEYNARLNELYEAVDTYIGLQAYIGND